MRLGRLRQRRLAGPLPCRWGNDSLFHNNGDGTFTEATQKLFRKRDGSPGTDWANGCAAIFLDYNLDGWLDIYVGNYFDEFDLWQPPPKPWQRPKLKTEPTAPKLSAAELEKMLSEMEARLRQSLNGYKLVSSYRARCAAYDQHDRSIKFFQQILTANPTNQRARLELGCAFADKKFNAYLAAEPDSWVGHYTRGINHLHWPRALHHSDDAARDLDRCVQLQQQTRKPAGKPYYLRTHVALGDAYAKNRQFDDARKAWRQGSRAFPDAKELKDRLTIQDDPKLLKYVEGQRSLERPIDTDLSFLDSER